MKAQVVRFLRQKEGQWEVGIALVAEFGLYDFQTIIDKHGKKVPFPVHNYRLVDGPMCHIDTQYGGK